MAIDTRIFNHDVDAGILEVFHYDEATDEVRIDTVQNCDALVETAKAEYNTYDESSGVGRSENFFKVGTIPSVMIENWKKQGIDIFTEDGKKWLMKNIINNRDYIGLRTRPGTY